MFKQKRLYEYLGEQNSFFDDRRSIRCTGVSSSPGGILSSGEVAQTNEAVFRIDVVAMTENIALVTQTNSLTNTLIARVISISGTSATIGAAQNLVSSILVGNITSVCKLTDTTALVVYLGSGNLVNCRVLTLSGSTVTAGAAATFASSGTSIAKVEAYSATQTLVVYRNTSSQACARVLDVSGTTITPGSEVVVSANAIDYQNVSILEGDFGLVTYLDTAGGGFIKARIVNKSGSTLSVPGSEIEVSDVGATTGQATENKTNGSDRAVVTWIDASNLIKSRLYSVSSGAITPSSQGVYTYARTGSAFSGYVFPSGKNVTVYNNKDSADAPHAMIANLASGSIVEGEDVLLDNTGLSFELAADGLNSTKFIGVYKDFSTGFLSAFVGVTN